MNSETLKHTPVMLDEVMALWLTDPHGVYVDATFGRGGHTKELLSKLASDAKMLVLDRDPLAIDYARTHLGEDDRVIIEHCAFSEIEKVTQKHGLHGHISGILMDVGVSSPQLEEQERGFSFMRNGPLDMRMNPQIGESAAERLATVGENEIADVLKKYGEEKKARVIARAIVRERELAPITTTGQLASLVEQVCPRRHFEKIHPATRTFQALRIWVNDELGELERALEQSLDVMKVGGRVLVITFHSLEDRIAKRFLREQSRDRTPEGFPTRQEQFAPRLKSFKDTAPSEKEIADNTRARSARLRAAERIK